MQNHAQKNYFRRNVLIMRQYCINDFLVLLQKIFIPAIRVGGGGVGVKVGMQGGVRVRLSTCLYDDIHAVYIIFTVHVYDI